MIASFLLLAAADDWLKYIPVFAFLIYLLNHFIGIAGKQQQRRQARPEVRPDGRPPRPRPAGQRQEVQDEVAEFLKRAAEKRSAAKPVEARPAQPRRVAPPEIVEARAVEEMPSNRWPESVRPQVENRELTERAGHLTHVDRTEAAFQAHMQVFDHTVGRINESAANPPPPTGSQSDVAPQTINAPPNEVFAALLSDPQSLRQAIILNEIIERPVERW
jgi:hypothetical protein